MRFAHLLLLSILLLASSCAHRPAPLMLISQTQMPMPVAQSSGPGKVPVRLSADGNILLTTDDQHAGLYATDLTTGSTRVITRSRNAGYYPQISQDGRFVGFKVFRENPKGELEQAAIVHDLQISRSYQIGRWAHVVSTPAFVQGMDRALVILDGRLLGGNLSGETSFEDLGPTLLTTVPNLLAATPDGSQIVTTETEFVAVFLSARTGEAVRRLPPAPLSIWGPVFSPCGDRIAFSTMNGRTLVWDRDSNSWLGPVEGESPTWIDERRLLAVAEEGRLQHIEVAGAALISREVTRIGQRWWTMSANRIATQQGPAINLMVYNDEVATIGSLTWKPSEDVVPDPPTHWPENLRDDGVGSPRKLVETSEYVRINGVPYIHQVYDVPDWFDGHWACNAVTAIMCLAYWETLRPNPITVSRPEPRSSNFATYVCERYTAGPKSFNIGSPDPKGREAWGAYGYIVRDNWRDTKNHIADYMEAHGVRSGVDWVPTGAKIRGEVLAGNPHILLHSITLAGHYVVGLGYLRGKQTVITHDPYGDKNLRTYPNIDGRFARYDLPGSNNGYQNLRVVHCLIYARERNGTRTAGN